MLNKFGNADVVGRVSSPPIRYVQLLFKSHKLLFSMDSAVEGSCVVSSPLGEIFACLSCKNTPVTGDRCVVCCSNVLLCPEMGMSNYII